MRFRTKLFIAWGILVLVLWISTFWPVHRTISSSFSRVASEAFTGTKQSLRGLQAEQISRMRQACILVMNIPELRALIAKSTAELTADNLESLQERLDNLSHVVAVPSIFVLDGHGKLIAQSQHSPWDTLPRLQNYLTRSPQAHALITRLYNTSDDANTAFDQAQYGIWPVGGQLYQVVAVPLTFQSQGAGTHTSAEGALIMATPLTDQLAAELAKRHNCVVSFLIGNCVIASSLAHESRVALAAKLSQESVDRAGDFNLQLEGVENTDYRSSFEPLFDPSSRMQVGGTLIQSNLQDASAVQSELWRDLAIIGLVGLMLAAGACYLLSAAVTRPVQSLLEGVRHVSDGDLEVSIQSKAGGELGELARAFNNMVQQISNRRLLERQVEESRAASQAKSHFLANMSHEIRTPLHGVMGMTDLLLKTNLDQKQQRYLGMVQTSAKILSTVINDILDFSKIEAGKLDLEAIGFDLRQTVGEVIDLLESKAQDKNLRLLGQVDSDLPAGVLGDPKRLQQILINLLNNAIKFTQAGHVSIHVTREGNSGDNDLIRFAVRDTGIGIPPDRMHRLFQSFSQVDASTTRKYGGTGLGLAICKQLAELMGGQIGVTSKPGQGATFWFTARLQPTAISSVPAARGDAATQAGTTPAVRSARLLVAEDNLINQIVIGDLLRACGHSCDIVSNGREVLEAVAGKPYDMILMDCQMPEMDGFETTRRLRQLEQAAGQNGTVPRHLPIIALTASAVTGDRDLCLQAGMDDYLSKPIDLPTLMATIARYVSGGSVPIQSARRARSS